MLVDVAREFKATIERDLRVRLGVDAKACACGVEEGVGATEGDRKQGFQGEEKRDLGEGRRVGGRMSENRENEAGVKWGKGNILGE